ncbi:class II glutamine amidotransferase [Nonomuraea salmonea]|uniref:class II glutamine amidotransferase n=1 Tax=Nonomuraea salmonea TaxID=46181 RepID=UPI0031EDE8B1
MCRHAAWLGAARPLTSLIHQPPHGLLTQSYAPRRQRHGTINADGYGMGWYDPARAEPVRYRRSVPMWTDANLTALAEIARSACLLAAVRSATVGMPIEESATAPFADRRWLLSHNGRVDRDAVKDLADGAESTCDAAWLAAAVFQRGRAGGRAGRGAGRRRRTGGGEGPRRPAQPARLRRRVHRRDRVGRHPVPSPTPRRRAGRQRAARRLAGLAGPARPRPADRVRRRRPGPAVVNSPQEASCPPPSQPSA